MTLTRTEILVIVFAILLSLSVLFLIGVYVYRDARKRGMSPAKWTLIATLAPALSGFAIYLLIRGERLGYRCPQCGTPVAADWILCPQCGQDLPEQGEIRRSSGPPLTAGETDRSLRRILLAVLMVPVLFVAAVTVYGVADWALSSESFGGTSSTVIPTGIYLRTKDNPEINAWWERCIREAKPGTAQVLRSRHQTDDTPTVQYIIYIPGLTEEAHSSDLRNSEGLFGGTKTISVDIVDGGGDDALLCIYHTGKGDPDLRLYRNGERLNYNVTDVEYSLDFIE